MNIFDEVNEDLFRPLTGINQRKYVDILALIWDKCKRMPMYAIEKSTIFDMVEEYLCGLGEPIELETEEIESETKNNEKVSITKSIRIANTSKEIETEKNSLPSYEINYAQNDEKSTDENDDKTNKKSSAGNNSEKNAGKSLENSAGNIDPRIVAGSFVRRLRDTGWLIEKEGEYEEESKLAVHYKVVPILKSFREIVSPTIITYKGKLFKIYSMFEHISEQGSPYEGVLKEASEDFDNLNLALRTLAASIEDHINQLTQGKKPEAVLEFFEKYEEKIVVGSYHRFKTNDNLFYYRTALYESLDKCDDILFDALVLDYMDTERADREEAVVKIKELIGKVRMDIEEMEAAMRTIDDRHIIYRTRAVQRAQFLLLSDGSAKSKINNILQFYASEIREKDDLSAEDDTFCGEIFQVFGQNFVDSASLATPVKKRSSTPIELMSVIEELDLELVEEKNRMIAEYIRNALTAENVNAFARELLQDKTAVSIGSVFENRPEILTKIVGLYTYSQTPEREYDIRLRDSFVECHGIRFKEFIVEKRSV